MKSRLCNRARRQGNRRRIEPYLDRLYGYALSLTPHPEQAHDLVQTCALKALVAKQVPLDEPAYRSWLCSRYCATVTGTRRVVHARRR